ncbi:MAG: hydroxyproline-2-epimerase [Planctomycetaceae bacterium]|nr:MAG: hydroxyproline-2-epimerase [Planctomycetaceae bacterium]
MNRKIRVIDSHTGGEPTRVVIDPGWGHFPAGWGERSLAEDLHALRRDHDDLRSICLHEPRGGEVWVGGLLCPPADKTCDFGVIFFNHIGYLGMCGHGTIGLVVTLAHLGRIEPGAVRIDTPVGPVEAVWHGGAEVSVTNVPSRRIAAGVVVEVPGIGQVSGDVVWSGNPFFLVQRHDETITASNVARLTHVALEIRRAVRAAGYEQVDHVELFGPPSTPDRDSKNFVLCPGGAYDRSPCGTGTSAKLACLAADGLLAEGQPWVQESIIGSTFVASYRWADRQQGEVIPTIRGSAYVTAEADLMVAPDDPFPQGISATSGEPG